MVLVTPAGCTASSPKRIPYHRGIAKNSSAGRILAKIKMHVQSFEQKGILRLAGSSFAQQGAQRSCGAALAAKTAQRGAFVVVHVEDGVELGDLEQVVHFFGQVEQLEFPAVIFHGGEAAHQLADA